MSRFGVSDHLINIRDCILCCLCERRVAYIEDFIPNADDLLYGGFFNRLELLINQSGETLRDTVFGVAKEQVPNEPNLGANDQNADQAKGVNQQVPYERHLGANDQNAKQHGYSNEQNTDEQDLGANDQNAEQHGDAKEQFTNKEDLGANDQNVEQDGGNNDQERDANEHNHGQHRGRPVKRMKMSI
uniref:Yippee domain-containing protein n=1 Tax=Solanum lycopersicum TaxID=4081 RepID=K4C9V6_SOLLC